MLTISMLIINNAVQPQHYYFNTLQLIRLANSYPAAWKKFFQAAGYELVCLLWLCCVVLIHSIYSVEWMEEELITWIEDCRGKNITPPLNICHDNRFSVSI